jgi:16S rRNA (adenine1518-N6/adenine1519-N6)-dimethyltransferase
MKFIQEPTPLDIPFILHQAEIKPSKGLGQNFLSDPNILTKIVDAADITEVDRILEIGPGLGSLTRYLASRAGQVTAVELDRKLFPLLTHHMQAYSNVQLVQGDILELNPDDLMQQSGYLVVANIPYYITSAVIRHLLESSCQPALLILTVQQEVAARICAKPGDLSLLALSVQVYGIPEILFRISAGAFYPPPKVDSAVLKVKLHPEPIIRLEQMDIFFKLIKAGFSQKRKTLRNSLSAGLQLPPSDMENLLRAAQIDPQRRAETLSIPEWNRLVDIFPS